MGRKELVLIDLGACTYLQPLPPAWPCPGHSAWLAASSFCCPAPATSSTFKEKTGRAKGSGVRAHFCG